MSNEESQKEQGSLADALTIATTVLVLSGPAVVSARGRDDSPESEVLQTTFTETVRGTVPWCQWLRGPSCTVDTKVRDDLINLADSVVVSLVALLQVLDGANDVSLTSTDELDRVYNENVKDWLSTHVSPDTVGQIEALASSVPESS